MMVAPSSIGSPERPPRGRAEPMKTKLIGAFLLGLLVAGGGFLALDLDSALPPSAAVPNSHSEGDGHAHGDESSQEQRKGDEGHGPEGEEAGVHLTEAQIARSGIEVVEAMSGEVSKERSEERRVGKECVSTCRSRWSPEH